MTDSQPNTHSLSRLNLLTLALLITALWLASHPFPGISADGRFYTFEALNALYPGRYADDLYFKYGSQDQFTVFTKFLAPLIGAVGMWRANIIGLLLSQFAWLAGLAYFSFGFFNNKRDAFLGLALVIILPFHIGFINSGETCLTPRLPAEALGLWAMGAMLRGRPVLCMVLLATALPIHPLIAIGAFGVFFVYQALHQPLWWAAAGAAIAAAFGLAIAGLQPFSRIFVSFDPTWFAIIYVRDSFCFISTWGLAIWPPIISTSALGFYGLFVVNETHRRLLLASLIVGWGGIITSYIGGDLLRNVLILDAQLWRCFWPCAIITYLLIPTIYRQTNLANPIFFFRGRFFLVQALIWLGLTELFFTMWLIASPMICLAALIGFYEYKTARQIPPMAGILCAAAAIVMCAGAVFGINLAIHSASLVLPQTPVLTLAALISLIILLQMVGSAKPVSRASIFTLILAMVLVGFSVTQWNRDSDAWTNYVDQTTTPPASLTALLPSTPVYWEGDATTSWFLLQRPSYFSCDQGTGTLFSRQTAITFERMYEHFLPLDTQDLNLPTICPTLPDIAKHPVTAATLATVCRQEPALGGVILLHDIPGAPHKTWISPVTYGYADRAQTPSKFVNINRFYIYNCAELQ
jgi:hypothetical protein